MITKHSDKALSAPESLGPVSKATQALRAALASYQDGKPCPHCNTVGKHCRPVPAGYWCQADGLLADASAYITTEPDPQAQTVKTDPQRQGAEMVLSAAQRAFDEADIAWRGAVATVEAARSSARRSEPVFDQNSPTGWRTTDAARTLALSVPRLEAAAAEAKRTRDARDTDLQIARRDYQRACDDALARAGLPQVGGNVAPTDLHSLVGGSW